MKADVEIARDLAKFPSLVNINIGGRKLTAEFDPEKGLTIEGSRAHLPSFSEILRMIYPVTSVLTIRGQNWFDRNAETVMLEYRGQLAPHVVTQRWTYTVPTDRMAFVELLGARILRRVAAAPELEPTAWVYYTPAGEAEIILCAVSLVTNNVGDNDREFIGQSLLLFEGDMIRAVTWDQSTGGNVEFHVRAKLTEFDA